MTLDNPSQGQRLGVLEPLIQERLGGATQIVEARRVGGLNAVLELYVSDRGKKLHDAIRGLVAEMIDTEKALLIERQAVTAHIARIALFAVVAASAVALGVVLSSILLIRRNFSEIQHAQAQCVRPTNGWKVESHTAPQSWYSPTVPFPPHCGSLDRWSDRHRCPSPCLPRNERALATPIRQRTG